MSSQLTAESARALTLRAAHAATRQAPLKVAEYSEQLDRVRRAEALSGIDAALWLRTATQVLELNARITMSAARAARGGRWISLPEPLALGGCDARRASMWCVRTAERLEATQVKLYRRLVRPRAAGALALEVSATLDRYERMLLDRYRGETGCPIVTRLDADMWVALRSLDPDAYEVENARVLAVVGQIARLVTYTPETAPYVAKLRSTIDAANDAVAGRRLAAKWLHASRATIAAGTRAPAFHTSSMAMMHRVVAGDAELDESACREAVWATEWAYGHVTRAHLDGSPLDRAEVRDR
ncbi:MAG TPA: hypothetical protein VFN97_04870 [Actinospica sp.]|nr:hypothetical protein [Actinospica sp.]